MWSCLRLAAEVAQARALCSERKSHLTIYFDHAEGWAERSTVSQRHVTRTQNVISCDVQLTQQADFDDASGPDLSQISEVRPCRSVFAIISGGPTLAGLHRHMSDSDQANEPM